MKYLSFSKISILTVILIFFSCKKSENEIKPVANFTTLIIEFGDVTFKNKSLNATEYLWDFGDGNTSTEKDPIHSYLTIGTFNVILTASDGVNSDTYDMVVAIGQVYPQNLTQLASPPFGERAEGFSFTLNGKGYIGGGIQFTPTYEEKKDLWEFDPSTKEWTLITDNLPSSFRQSVSFVADNSAYFGLGTSMDYTFWKYDFHNQTLIPESSLPLSVMENGFFYNAAAFVHNDIPYLIGKAQFGSASNEKKIWKYDTQLQEWNTIGDYQCEGNSEMYHFLLGDKLYIGMGTNSLNFYNTNDIWEYDVINNTWLQKNDFPGLARRGGFGFTYDGVGYFGFGNGIDLNTGMQTLFSDLWKYHPDEDTWEKIADFPVSSKFHNYSFIIGNSLFFGGGYGSNFQSNDSFFEYEF